MNLVSPIIAGIDFSESSESVLLHALHASGGGKRPVIALHVLDASRLSHLKASKTGSERAATIEDDAEAKLASWVSKHASSQDIRLEIRSGRPAEELHKAVKEHEASLLVIAANDETKKRLGSIASRCVRAAPCDVMVLRNWKKGNFRKIVLCTDFSATADHALSQAVSLASEQDAHLEIVHVMYPPTRDVWGEALEHKEDTPEGFIEECRAEINDSMSKFTEPHREALAAIENHITILESEVPSVALTNFITDNGADLVVLGTRGHSVLLSHFIGTNAERLMYDSPVSVLAIRSAS